MNRERLAAAEREDMSADLDSDASKAIKRQSREASEAASNALAEVQLIAPPPVLEVVDSIVSEFSPRSAE